MADNYEGLRSEIVTWQERRFTIFSGALTLLFGVLTFVLSNADNWSWASALSIEFLVVACACAISWYAGWGNAIAGAFIGTMCEENQKGEWELFLEELKKRRAINDWIHMNSVFVAVYALFLVGSGATLAAACTKRPPSWLEIGVVIALGLLCVWMLASNVVPWLQYPRGFYREVFRKIKSDLHGSPPPSAP